MLHEILAWCVVQIIIGFTRGRLMLAIRTFLKMVMATFLNT